MGNYSLNTLKKKKDIVYLLLFINHKGELMEQVEEKLMTPKKFSIAIEKAVKEGGGTYMDALLDYCEKYQQEPEMIKPLITKSLKEKVEVDARNLNYLPKVATLPI